ncbi:superoxide dismutase [Cu-Zn]-like [Homarus americanus]|uniref:Superoxide dismutase [Cu-Zn] n=1 Tax=Homarus americanus TaxID=6706 RepID=A0A8J5N8J3_HOMAM|nr:superoxide dismutase [Cu-Zn]-like [Homarus americanus]KAG7175866.1 Superoxide dismutase [Cu-Zn]-like 2 [Homarus americanus]
MMLASVVLELLLLSCVVNAQDGPAAVVRILPGNEPAIGLLALSPSPGGVTISGTILGMRPGVHGFHVHERGDLTDKCAAAGGHFNPFNRNHGGPGYFERHVGDLGNIVADQFGSAQVFITDNHLSLDPTSPAFIGDRAIVIHAGADDLGQGGNAGSLITGNAGSRAACGIIRLTYPSSQLVQQQPVYPQLQPTNIKAPALPQSAHQIRFPSDSE